MKASLEARTWYGNDPGTIWLSIQHDGTLVARLHAYVSLESLYRMEETLLHDVERGPLIAPNIHHIGFRSTRGCRPRLAQSRPPLPVSTW